MAEIDPKILGRFLLIQNTMHVMPYNRGISEYICHGISTVPGICSAGICIHGQPDEPIKFAGQPGGLTGNPENSENPCSGCTYPSNPERALFNHSCLWGQEKNICCISLQTESNRYGYLLIHHDGNREFFKYQPYVENLANHVALILENRRQNEILNESKRQLEKTVENRTSELKIANDHLMTEIEVRKHAEEALKESEKKYRRVVENVNEGITVAQDGMLKFINRKTVELTGYSEEELMSRPFIDFIHPDDHQVVMQNHMERLKGEKMPEIFTARILAKDDIIKWVESNGKIITWEGKPATLNLLTDITERKKMEEELLRAQKLESVGVLAGGIAHDFNNILTTILGNISLARMQANPGEDLYDLLREAEMASTRAQALTRQLLPFAKGGMPVKDTASIKELLKESTLFVLRGSKSICEFSIADDLWSAEVDVGQISQVIHNIVINANQAMPKGGTIEVGAKNLIIEARDGLPVKPGRYIRISIKDQGVGIAEDHLLNIFDPYFTTKQERSGLGLATTYSIIKKHDGHITVESQQGAGTVFQIYLPVSGNSVPEKEEDKIIKGTGRILVMDDEAQLRTMMGRMLKSLGYSSDFAKDGVEAIGMVTAAKESGKPYDAVILDLTIPGGMGGNEAIIQLLKIDPELKAIVSSGYSDDPVLSNFKEYGFKGVIPKPFESHLLSKVLHEVLKGEEE